MRLDRSEPGEGIVFYSGEKKGDWFVAVGLGFSGWEIGGGRNSWRFMHPYVHFGRLFSDSLGRRYSFKLRCPAWAWDRINDRREER
jgi:hypothetical protein